MKRTEIDEPTTLLPRDEYSTALREKSHNPVAVTKQSVVDLVDLLGNAVTWVVKTIRVEGDDTVFIQRNDATGGARFVLPAQVTAVLARHRDGAVKVNRRRAARSTAARRKSEGFQPFVKKGAAA